LPVVDVLDVTKASYFDFFLDSISCLVKYLRIINKRNCFELHLIIYYQLCYQNSSICWHLLILQMS